MNTKMLALLGLLILGLCGLVRAGSILDLDHAEFRAGDSLAYVEIYAAIQRSNLIYVPNADTLTAEFDLVLEILQSDTVALSDTLHAVDVRDTAAVEGASGQFFVHVFRFVMLPGAYGLRASLYQFDSEPRDDDEVVESAGIKVFVDPLTQPLIEGLRVDFVQSFEGSGFTFDNPNAGAMCGCGKSFGC
jgi:iron-sulfur cluster assembly protein